MNLLVSLGEVNAETWKTVGIVAGILAGIALVLVIAILVIGKVFKVNVDGNGDGKYEYKDPCCGR